MRINISLPPETLEKLDRQAKTNGLTRSAYISWLVNRQPDPKFNDEHQSDR